MWPTTKNVSSHLIIIWEFMLLTNSTLKNELLKMNYWYFLGIRIMVTLSYCTCTWSSISSKAWLACAVEVSSRICTRCIFIAIMDPGAAFIGIWIARKDTGTQLTISKPFDKNHPQFDRRSPSSLNKHDCLNKALTYECGQLQKTYHHIL